MSHMDEVLHPYFGKFVVVFLDNILIYSKTKQEHLEHLTKVFDLLRANHLYVKMSKCENFMKQIHYLRHIVSSNGIQMDPAKVKVILQWPEPRNVDELQTFLGMVGFYRQYVCDYAKISCPMTDQLKGKGKSFQWGDAQRKSFETLKVAVAAAPTLKVVDPNQPYELDTDASGEAVGAVLTQGGRPVAFESKKLNRAQRNYLAYERDYSACSQEVVTLFVWRYFYNSY